LPLKLLVQRIGVLVQVAYVINCTTLRAIRFSA